MYEGYIPYGADVTKYVPDLQRGDVFDAPGAHTEIYLGNNLNAGAHDDFGAGSKDATTNEINVANYNTHYWTIVLRYTGDATLNPYDKTSKYYLGCIGQYP